MIKIEIKISRKKRFTIKNYVMSVHACDRTMIAKYSLLLLNFVSFIIVYIIKRTLQGGSNILNTIFSC